jgi:hypothetical protein
VSLSTNVPSTIFYTLDGTEPTIFSNVYLTEIVMPTVSPANLRALAVSGVDSGILDITFSTDSTDLAYHRRIDGYGMGVVVDAYNEENLSYDGYVSDGSGNITVPARFSDYELDDLDILFSRTGPAGIGPGTITSTSPPPISQLEAASAIDSRASSPNNQNVYFNPRSLYIVIDGRDGYSDQSVEIINRTYTNTMDMVKYNGGKLLYNPQPYISGGFVKRFYSIRDGYGLSCSYYFDHNETRWIKSIQRYDLSSVPQGIGDRRQFGPPLVFKWIYNKRSMI